MSNTLQIHLPNHSIPVKTAQVKTNVPKIVEILKTISSGKD
jgi:hypothetical protein